MEDSSTLNPSDAAFSFPPHRRRPLRSRTYRALIGILSHCHTNSTQLQTQEEVDAGRFEPRPVTEENGSITPSEVNSKAELVPLPNSKHSEETRVKENSIGENKENINFQDGSVDCTQATTPKLDHITLVIDGRQEIAPTNSISNGDLLVEKQMGGCAIQVAQEQEDANIVPGNLMVDIGTFEELQMDKDFSIDDYSEVLDSCFGMDMVIESSKTAEISKENGTVLEENIHKEAEHELELKEIELAKLIYSSDAVTLSSCLNADEEIEEGEISGEAGVVDASFDALYEDVASLGEQTTEIVHTAEYINKDEFMRIDEDRECRQHQMPDPSMVSIVNSDCNSMKVENKPTAGETQDCHSQNASHDSHIETQKRDSVAPCSEKLSPLNRNLRENAAENLPSASYEKECDGRIKKRKNGPLTKERRAKKKKKERLKRAEKNRKLGVKRLKLQPVLKPKTVSYCRHYLHGRCHEGDNCKFSHDTVPLTKSKPCGHFARHSCMKGDDCPFDHQLSKYPCNNFTTNGFCSRGSDCLFSHEMPAKQTASKPELTSTQRMVSEKGGSVMLSKVSKPEVNFSSQLNKSTSSKHMDNHGMVRQKVDAKFCSAGNNSPGKSTELLPTRTFPKIAGKAPRGISFLSNGGMSLGDKTMHKQDGSANEMSNEMSEKAAPRNPRGINFLSFGRPTLDDLNSKMFSNLLSNSNNEARKSVTDDVGEGELTCSLPQSVGILQVNKQMNQNAINLVRDLNEKGNGNFWTVPQQRNFLSFDKAHLDDPIINERAHFHFKKDDSVLPSVTERQSTPSKLQEPIRMHSLSFSGLSDQSTGGQSATSSISLKTSFLPNTPSSVQKAVQSTLEFAANFEPHVKFG